MSEKVQELPVVQVERLQEILSGECVAIRCKADDIRICLNGAENNCAKFGCVVTMTSADWGLVRAAYAALLAERDALRAMHDHMNERAQAAEDACASLQTELARLRGQGEALVAKWRGECDELRKCGPDEYLDGRMYELEACADDQAAAMSTPQEASNG